MLMAACAFIGTQHRDVIVFKNLCFHLSTRHCQKRAFLKRWVFTGYVWAVGKTGGKKISRFQTKTDMCARGLRWDYRFTLNFLFWSTFIRHYLIYDGVTKWKLLVELWVEFNNTLSAITTCGNKFGGTQCFRSSVFGFSEEIFGLGNLSLAQS